MRALKAIIMSAVLATGLGPLACGEFDAGAGEGFDPNGDVLVELAAEYEVEIPSSAAYSRLSWTADAPVAMGARLGLHLHNHGFNSWTIVRIGLAAPS